MDNEIIKIEDVNIKSLIYTVRGKQVMIDSDVAMLYHYETKNINKAMKRNIERFPEDFCFQLTKEEIQLMWFQNGTTYENMKYRSEQYLPYAYTEQGISMLAGILKNEIAVQVSIDIIRAFVEMRRFINTNKNLFERVINIENTMDKNFANIGKKLISHDSKFEQIFNELQKDEGFKQKIFFEGQIYDAYSLIIDITKKAKTDKFHDRFIIIDNKELYHCGASIKDLGKKCFGINKIEDKSIIDKIMI